MIRHHLRILVSMTRNYFYPFNSRCPGQSENSLNMMLHSLCKLVIADAKGEDELFRPFLLLKAHNQSCISDSIISSLSFNLLVRSYLVAVST